VGFKLTTLVVIRTDYIGRGKLVGFAIKCAISDHHHENCEFQSRTWQGVLDATLYDKVCRLFATGQWFSLDDILLKVPGNTITKNTDYIGRGKSN
jgi:hypothetical protein